VGDVVTDPVAWFDAHTGQVPAELVERARQYFTQATGAELGTRLASAGERALASAIAAGTDRTAALDLLAADALVTLALLERAERDPASLGPAAREIWRRGVAGS
jgi:hypothetical protein